MRDYKFRGINKLTKDVWEYGAYVPGGTTIAGVRDHTIVSPGCYATEVKPETVGQFTGLKDKNGVEIYEKSQIDERYYVDFLSCSYVLIEISSGDIIKLQDYYDGARGDVEVTREYQEV